MFGCTHKTNNQPLIPASTIVSNHSSEPSLRSNSPSFSCCNAWNRFKESSRVCCNVARRCSNTCRSSWQQNQGTTYLRKKIRPMADGEVKVGILRPWEPTFPSCLGVKNPIFGRLGLGPSFFMVFGVQGGGNNLDLPLQPVTVANEGFIQGFPSQKKKKMRVVTVTGLGLDPSYCHLLSTVFLFALNCLLKPCRSVCKDVRIFVDTSDPDTPWTRMRWVTQTLGIFSFEMWFELKLLGGCSLLS